MEASNSWFLRLSPQNGWINRLIKSFVRQRKTDTMKRNILLIFGALVIVISSYLLGLAQGTNRGVKGSNSASILFFTGIHRSLKAGDLASALKLAEDGIATHAGVIQTAEDHPRSALVHLYPWMGDPLQDTYKKILGGTYIYLSEYPQAVPRDTTDFLARYQGDYQGSQK